MNEQHYLTPLFEPRSVAIIGASERENSMGSVIVRNMLEAGFKGKLFAVNPTSWPAESRVVTIVTPVAKEPRACRNCFGSNDVALTVHLLSVPSGCP